MANEISITTNTLEQFNQAVAQLMNVSDIINQLAESQNESRQDITDLNTRMDHFENTLTITNAQACNIQKQVKAHVRKLLGNPISRDYIRYSRTCFGHLWSDLKDRFGVTSYHDIRQADYDLAVEYVIDWMPDGGVQALKNEVDIRLKGGEDNDI